MHAPLVCRLEQKQSHGFLRNIQGMTRPTPSHFAIVFGNTSVQHNVILLRPRVKAHAIFCQGLYRDEIYGANMLSTAYIRIFLNINNMSI